MRLARMTGALAAVLALAAGASGEEARRPPIDEAKIQAEMDALQDAAAPLPQETAERASKLLREGVKLHDESKLEAALAKYREAIALAPLYAAAYYEMSFSLAELGRNAESLEAITRALALDPKEEQFYVLKGNILDNLGFPEQAKATYRALLEVMPNSYMGLINLGVCHLRANENEEAEGLLRRARDLAPDHPSAYYHLATAARARGYNYEERALLEQFLERGKTDARADSARKRLEEMNKVNVEVDPTDAFAHIALAVAMKRALWSTEEHRKRHPEARGYALTFEEEQEVLRLILSLWREQKKKDTSSRHGFYDLVLAVDDAGFLDEYIYYTKQRALGETAQPWLAQHDARVQAFLAWAREKGYLRDEAAKAASAKEKEEEHASAPMQLLALMTESKVSYLIGVEVENAAPRFLEEEAKRFRKGLDLSGPQEVACVESGDYAARMKAVEPKLIETILRCHPQDGPARQAGLAQLTRVGVTARDLDLALAGGVFEKDGKVQIAFSDDSTAPVAYWLAKAAWPREATLREGVAGKGAKSPSIEEEMYAVIVAAEGYTNSLEGEGDKRGAPSPAWDEVVRVVKAGRLRGFVLYEILGRRYGMSLARLSEADAAALDSYLREFVEKRVAQ